MEEMLRWERFSDRVNVEAEAAEFFGLEDIATVENPCRLLHFRKDSCVVDFAEFVPLGESQESVRILGRFPDASTDLDARIVGLHAEVGVDPDLALINQPLDFPLQRAVGIHLCHRTGHKHLQGLQWISSIAT